MTQDSASQVFEGDPALLARLKHDYEHGLLSPRLLVIRYCLGTTDKLAAIALQHRWGEHGAKRSGAIERVTQQAIVDRVVSADDRAAGRDTAGGTLIDADEQLERFGQHLAGVIDTQRKDIRLGRELSGQYLAELKALTPPVVDTNAIESLANEVAAVQPELALQLRQNIGPMTFAERKAFLKERIRMLAELAPTQERYIDMERESYGLNVKAGNPGAPQVPGSADDLIDRAQQELREGR